MQLRVLVAALALCMVCVVRGMPESCEPLEDLHGSVAMSNFLLQAQQALPNQEIGDICSQTVTCKKLLSPLMTPDGRQKVPCPKDCSGYGTCIGGECACEAGRKGLDCAESACKGECKNGGKCRSNGVCECVPGYKGNFCEETVPCKDGCNRQGICFAGQCHCYPGRKGEACEATDSCPEDCNGRGTCVAGECFCEKGFTGHSCRERLVGDAEKCPQDCSGHGECKSGTCFCDSGHYGSACEKETACAVHPESGLMCGGSSRGNCVAGRCECLFGRTGASCENESECKAGLTKDGPCSGRGTCFAGRCYCRPGFTGEGCEEQAPCASSCNDNGVCDEDGKCKCLPGCSGDQCELGTCGKASLTTVKENRNATGGAEWSAVDFRKLTADPAECPSACSTHGVCVKGGVCVCSPGYGGDDCSVALFDTACPLDCSGRGVCIAGTCSCMSQYKGAACELVNGLEADRMATGCSSAANCSGHGTCVDGSCVCITGYSGPDCSSEARCVNDCSGNGKCRAGACTCVAGFTGSDCSQLEKCPEGCSAHGLCMYGRCHCESNYGGERCEIPTGCPNGCDLNTGHCQGNGMCQCTPGWTGVDCTKRVECGNCNKENGYCELTEQGARCICKPGFSGPSCDVDSSQCPNDCSGKGACIQGKCRCSKPYTGKDCSMREGGDSILDVVNANIKADEDAAKEAAEAVAVGAAEENNNEEGDAAELQFREKRLDAASATATQAASSLRKAAAAGASVAAAFNKGVRVEQPASASIAARFAEVRAGAKAASCTSPADCSNRGVCTAGVCTCDPGFAGDTCDVEMQCPNDCGTHGICSSGKCFCASGYGGEGCTEELSQGRTFPQVWVTAILSSVTFFVGILVGRKTMAASVYKNLSTAVDFGDNK